ncbi:MAG TPA: hypothetical protein IAC99_00235 [Candidatus Choladocola avistercoris]|nr:hypothetical protein [Candidatus Choladocola avistercoris]
MKSYEKKLMMPAILAAAVCFACTGCGKMTEEKLMENMGKAMEGRTFLPSTATAALPASGAKPI